jgi:putative transposase
MAEKFRNKYRVPSARLENWDYGSNGAYFITICTKEMAHFFGEVVDKKMILNSVGELAEKYWIEILNQFPYVELGNFQIMPNHMHGILIIDKSRIPVQTRFIASRILCDTPIASESLGKTPLMASVPRAEIGGFAGENNPMLNENISRIIRWYKGRCTFEMRKINVAFEWHSRFYDHIIKNSDSFERIQNYIEENPLKWAEDKFYKK